MSLPTFNRDYARWYSLRRLTNITVDSYEHASDELINVHFGGDPEAFSAYLATAQVPMALTAAHMRELLDLIVATSVSDYTLGYEDRDFLTRVRSHLCDAFVSCLGGDIEAVVSATDHAYQQLYFLTYERKRTDKRNFHNPFAVERPRFERLTARASKLSQAITRASVSA